MSKRPKDAIEKLERVTGKPRSPKRADQYLSSEMIRVSREFAQLVRNLAAKEGVSVTEVTRFIALEHGVSLMEPGKEGAE